METATLPHWTMQRVHEPVTTRVYYHAVEGDPFEEVEFVGWQPGYSKYSLGRRNDQVLIRRNGEIWRTSINSLSITTSRW